MNGCCQGILRWYLSVTFICQFWAQPDCEDKKDECKERENSNELFEECVQNQNKIR